MTNISPQCASVLKATQKHAVSSFVIWTHHFPFIFIIMLELSLTQYVTLAKQYLTWQWNGTGDHFL